MAPTRRSIPSSDPHKYSKRSILVVRARPRGHPQSCDQRARDTDRAEDHRAARAPSLQQWTGRAGSCRAPMRDRRKLILRQLSALFTPVGEQMVLVCAGAHSVIHDRVKQILDARNVPRQSREPVVRRPRVHKVNRAQLATLRSLHWLGCQVACALSQSGRRHRELDQSNVSAGSRRASGRPQGAERLC